jgi:hypothetical protein
MGSGVRRLAALLLERITIDEAAAGRVSVLTARVIASFVDVVVGGSTTSHQFLTVTLAFLAGVTVVLT